MKNSDVNFTIPTIFLAECVLVYIEVQNCSNLLKWFTSNFQCAGEFNRGNFMPNVPSKCLNILAFINYEQVSMNDRFGEVMLSNLRARGCSLAGVECCISLETQIQRYCL